MRVAPAQGEQNRGQERKAQGVSVGRGALRGMAEHEGNRGAERGDLRQREIDEDHVAREHLDAEIGVDADEADGHQKRWPEKCNGIHHRITDAASSASTLASNSAK